MSTSTAEAAPPAAVAPASLSHSADADILVNDARPLRLSAFLAGFWANRALIMVLARKDFYVRYRRSWLGLFWVLLVPLVQASVLTAVFSHVGRFSAGVPHYPIYVFSGFLAWSFFASSLTAGSTAIVDGKELAGRVYFPRAVLPAVKLATDSFGLASSVGILVVLSVVFGVHLGLRTLILLPALALLLALTMGFTLVLSALHVHFRDVRFIVSTVILPWFYVTPVFYRPEQLSGSLGRLLAYNPVSGVLDAIRAATVGAGPGWRTAVTVSGAVAALLLLAGMEMHRRLDRTFIDKL